MLAHDIVYDRRKAYNMLLAMRSNREIFGQSLASSYWLLSVARGAIRFDFPRIIRTDDGSSYQSIIWVWRICTELLCDEICADIERHEEYAMNENTFYIMSCCNICPRQCGVDRVGGQRGVCGVGADVIIARAALHYWEEPCISGGNGSGAVFFAGCSLGCVFCQNAEISLKRPPEHGKVVSVEHLADIFINLQDISMADNINLVTATHYIPQVAEAISIARDKGLKLPVIYNSSGYEKKESLEMLSGLIDIYLPDFKYLSQDLAERYSHARDYPEYAKAALREMADQTGPARLSHGLIRRGVIVRNLLLPGHVNESKKVVKYLHDTYGSDIIISLLNQYTPMAAVGQDSLLKRRVTKREYDRLVSYAIAIGVENGYIQDGETAVESFIPSWNSEGII